MTENCKDEPCTLEEEEDSDDNVLHSLPPALLQTTSSLRCESKMKPQHDSSLESDRSELKYSLHQISRRNVQQNKDNHGLSKLQKTLRSDIEQGGITKLIEEEDERHGQSSHQDQHLESTLHNKNTTCRSENNAKETLLPEHEEKLQQYALEDERIAPLHPGEEIFCKGKIGKIFSFPGRLSLLDCGFNSNNADAMEKLLMTSASEEVEELIVSRTIDDMYLVKQCPNSVMLWLLQLMSIHEGMMIAGTIFDMMWSTMNLFSRLHPTIEPWVPTIKDIVEVFMNYGAKMDTLLPPTIFQEHFTIRVVDCPQSKHPQAVPRLLPVSNLRQVIQMLTHCLVIARNRKASLNNKDLQSLAYIICKVSLDKQLTGCAVRVDFEQCLAAILSCFDEGTWHHEASVVCKMLIRCSDHHHNLVYLAQLIPASIHRGRVFRRLLSYAALRKLTSHSESVDQHYEGDFGELKVNDLLPLLSKLNPKSRLEVDYQHLHSVITLVDLAVGSNIYLLKSSDKESLASLVVKLRDMAGDIRESHKHLCRTQVKDMMIQTASKLTYFEQNLTTKQTYLQTILNYDQCFSEDPSNTAHCESNHHIDKDLEIEASVPGDS
ncbi:protein FAM178B-like isoform X2 [Asterias amurensis]|uniref:protein FAM178B-like isoform X2 n=1 Tax=Asterias amurensis TaxID=7602 RepID=UPI003AB906E0